MRRIERSVGIAIQLDANRINARGALQYVNQLERWDRDGVILLSMSEVAQREAAAGGDRKRESKAHAYMSFSSFISTPGEVAKLATFSQILFGRRRLTPEEGNDALIVFNSWKYGRLLVTADGDSKTQPGGILGKRTALLAEGVEAITDHEAVRRVRARISTRDELARLTHVESGEPLQSWVGRD